MTQYLIGVGGQKCGTTLLYELLEAHPALSKAKLKELHYFDRTQAPDRQAYDAMFDGLGMKLDVTPSYMFAKGCMEKMVRTLGAENMKVVVLLRDPIERALSHYYMEKERYDTEPLSFPESFAQEAERMARSERDHMHHSYFARGLYAEQLRNIYRHVPRENVRVYLFEEFVKDQQSVIDDVCDFAGIERIVVRDKHSNRGVYNVRSKLIGAIVLKLSLMTPRAWKLKFLRKLKHMITRVNEKPEGKQPLDPAFVAELVAYFRADVMMLRDEFGLRTSVWKNYRST